LASRGLLKICHFITSIPKACSTRIRNCERKKLKASLDGFILVAPLYGIKRVDDNVYALSPTTKSQLEAEILCYECLMHKKIYYPKLHQGK
jgi:hypothetical protein